jgi:hypothetical protein
MINLLKFLFILLACCVEVEAAEQPENILDLELGKAALEMLYVGDPPGSIKDAVERFLKPKKKFYLVEEVENKTGKWVYREVKR